MRMVDAWSPNFNDRRGPVDMLVLHYTGMETGEAALARLRDPASNVSAHYLVEEDGVVHRLVPEAKRAWHAGVSRWQGDEDLNSRSIGIEIVNGGHDWPGPDGSPPPYPEVQIAAVASLGQAILARHAISQSRIVGHSDIAPARKQDPGEHFPWARLAAAGIGLWPAAPDPDGVMGTGLAPGATGPAVARLQAALARIGYDLSATGTYDEATRLAVTAFQRRFAPERVTGDADWTCLARIVGLADRI